MFQTITRFIHFKVIFEIKHKLINLKSSCECELKLTKKQTENRDFLGLHASIGILW